MRPPWLPWLDHVGSNKSMEVPTHLWVSRSIFKVVANLDQGLSIFPNHIFLLLFLMLLPLFCFMNNLPTMVAPQPKNGAELPCRRNRKIV
jgi:hypothetical protein